MKLQIATSSLKDAGQDGRRYAPFAFNEHGAIIGSMVLNSVRATEVSVHVATAFIELRNLVAANKYSDRQAQFATRPARHRSGGVLQRHHQAFQRAGQA